VPGPDAPPRRRRTARASSGPSRNPYFISMSEAIRKDFRLFWTWKVRSAIWADVPALGGQVPNDSHSGYRQTSQHLEYSNRPPVTWVTS
jgi:hypothetical protein